MSDLMNPGLIDAAVRLAEMLARENAALAALDLAGAASMLAEKQDAVAAFALAWERVRRFDPVVDPNGVAMLAGRLDAAVTENRRLLERGIEVQRRVLQIVAGAVPRALAAASPSRYGAGGTAPPSARIPVAMSLRA